jgi:hypothetical protein
VRVNISRVSIYNICSPEQQAKLPTTLGNTYTVYITVSQRVSGKKGWDMQFDIFPFDNNTATSITRQTFLVLEEGDKEAEYDRLVDTVALFNF